MTISGTSQKSQYVVEFLQESYGIILAGIIQTHGRTTFVNRTAISHIVRFHFRMHILTQ